MKSLIYRSYSRENHFNKGFFVEEVLITIKGDRYKGSLFTREVTESKKHTVALEIPKGYFL